MLPSEYSVEGKTVIITGAARGIGKGIARVLAESGAKVMVTSLTNQYLVPLSESMAADGHPIEILTADATKSEDWQRTYDYAMEKGPRRCPGQQPGRRHTKTHRASARRRSVNSLNRRRMAIRHRHQPDRGLLGMPDLRPSLSRKGSRPGREHQRLRGPQRQSRHACLLHRKGRSGPTDANASP